MEDFDRKWTIYEKFYVFELMLIEKDARRHIINAIEIEEEIKTYEIRERLKGRVVIRSQVYDKLRRDFLETICRINTLANSEGKGRDDLTIDILISAENILRKVSDLKSKAVRKLAIQIKATFSNIRTLFRKYGKNLDAVDPQMKNNLDLADALLAFEKAWEKGKEYLVEPVICQMLISFSRLIESITEKHKEMKEKIEAMDTEVFIIIPCLAILYSVETCDYSLINCYYPFTDIQDTDQQIYNNIRELYLDMKKGHDGFDIYNLIELAILDKEINTEILRKANVSKEQINNLINELKKGAFLLQRNKPTEWNTLMETAMGII